MSAGSGEPAACGEQPGGRQAALALGFAHFKSRLAIRSNTAHRSYAEIEKRVEILLDTLPRVILSPVLWAAARTRMHVQVDQSRNQEFPLPIDFLHAGRNGHVGASPYSPDTRTRHDDHGIRDRRPARAVNQDRAHNGLLYGLFRRFTAANREGA